MRGETKEAQERKRERENNQLQLVQGVSDETTQLMLALSRSCPMGARGMWDRVVQPGRKFLTHRDLELGVAHLLGVKKTPHTNGRTAPALPFVNQSTVAELWETIETCGTPRNTFSPNPGPKSRP